jgi:hypothetical protein
MARNKKVKQSLLEIWTELESERIKAFESGDAVRYSVLSDYSGINIENDELYSIGKSDPNYNIELDKVDEFYARKLDPKGYKENLKNLTKKKYGYKDLFTEEFIPSTSKGYQLEIRRICKKTGKKLPKEFYKKDKEQLAGMYFGIRDWYKNKEKLK